MWVRTWWDTMSSWQGQLAQSQARQKKKKKKGDIGMSPELKLCGKHNATSPEVTFLKTELQMKYTINC